MKPQGRTASPLYLRCTAPWLSWKIISPSHFVHEAQPAMFNLIASSISPPKACRDALNFVYHATSIVGCRVVRERMRFFCLWIHLQKKRKFSHHNQLYRHQPSNTRIIWLARLEPTFEFTNTPGYETRNNARAQGFSKALLCFPSPGLVIYPGADMDEPGSLLSWP
ncbi:hypothetical protein BT63DRAFT_426129 [Microthyrium microscopicum]|uniref:Uncharacterized protein n=1 Tax=Microthyrium microscopicum TaxID=703497 RepID=A0A6A6U9D9_9PEZI|nr:hypothetical protein BT63DRAFT_426129 [Microthyrium microscopicum]